MPKGRPRKYHTYRKGKVVIGVKKKGCGSKLCVRGFKRKSCACRRR
ncbi:MAG: hypothetical protein PHI12_14615 [Dehalococcoidales bacterium]|nr:hypothetical protein [Dehalococcoidales bacterium]